MRQRRARGLVRMIGLASALGTLALWLLIPTESVAQSPTYGGSIKIAQGADVVNLDPAYGIDSVGYVPRRHFFERLVELDPKTSAPLPGLAESWTVSSDGLTWTFHLRRNVKFHDGTPLDAEAVKFNLERILNPETKSPFRHLIGVITKIETPDSYTVKLTTSSPFASLLNNLAHSALEISSPPQVRKLGQDYRRHPIGTGPFKFVRQVPGLVEIEANKEYWGGRPYLDKIEVVAIPEESVRSTAVEAGDVDVAVQVSPIDVDRLQKSAKVNVIRAQSTRPLFVGINTRVKPLDDVRVRHALNYAVDKKALVSQVLRGVGSPADSVLGRGTFGYAHIMTYEYNPQKAKELLAQAGYPKGFSTTVTVAPGRYTMDINVVEAVQAYLQKVGVEAQIVRMEWGAFLGTLKNPNHQLQLYYLGWGTSSGDATDGLYPELHSNSFPPKNYNAGFYSNPKVDELIDEQARTVSQQKRLEVLRELQKIVMQDAPWIFLYHEEQVTAANKKVRGLIVPTTLSIDARKAWLEK